MMKAGDFFATDLEVSVRKVKLYPEAIGYEIHFDYPHHSSINMAPVHDPTIVRLYENDLRELREAIDKVLEIEDYPLCPKCNIGCTKVSMGQEKLMCPKCGWISEKYARMPLRDVKPVDWEPL
jgi:hypothetical protein